MSFFRVCLEFVVTNIRFLKILTPLLKLSMEKAMAVKLINELKSFSRHKAMAVKVINELKSFSKHKIFLETGPR